MPVAHTKDFVYTGAVETYTIQQSGYYEIYSAGAQGGNNDSILGGYGATVDGQIHLDQGTLLGVIAGGVGGNGWSVYGAGGGGGSFIFIDVNRNGAPDVSDTLLAAAGGGGGASNLDGTWVQPGNAGTAGSWGMNGGSGGVNGGGGGGNWGGWYPVGGGGGGWGGAGGSGSAPSNSGGTGILGGGGGGAGESTGEVYRLYLAVLGRNPESDPTGCGYWIDKMDRHLLNMEGLVNYFLTSEEFITRFGSSTSSNESFVNLLYLNVLGRDGHPDPGFAFWQSVLDSNLASRAQVVVGFIESPENIANVATLIGDHASFKAWTEVI